MKALLDTNIIIHREAGRPINQDIGILFKWLDKVKYQKYIHLVTIDEIRKNTNQQTVHALNIKLDSYEHMLTIAPMTNEVSNVSNKYDQNENDRNDSILLNEVFVGRVDILISEDKKIHTKATALGINDRVYNINTFLEKIYIENPNLVNYNVLDVKQTLFGDLDLNDSFFDSLKEDYESFDSWFHSKSNETAYVTVNSENAKLLSFLYLKKEDKDEPYPDIQPTFTPKKRLKVGTFKIVSNGFRLGERFMKIIFDNALAQKVNEIYVTIFEKRDEHKRLITLLEEWGFLLYGTKGNDGELVYVRDFSPRYNHENPKLTYPYISLESSVYLVPIYPSYHTDLLPDSYLNTEDPEDYTNNVAHRNALSKVYVCRSIERSIKTGDIIVFYRTAPRETIAHYTSVITTIGVVEEKIEDIEDENDFINKCRKRSVFSNEELGKMWNYNSSNRPFIINFLYIYSFQKGKRMNRKALLEKQVIEGYNNELRGLKKITKDQFLTILKNTDTNESIIVN